jgi:hypothetical protein
MSGRFLFYNIDMKTTTIPSYTHEDEMKELALTRRLDHMLAGRHVIDGPADTIGRIAFSDALDSAAKKSERVSLVGLARSDYRLAKKTRVKL